MKKKSDRSWPYDKPLPTDDSRVTYILVHDWRWQRFSEEAVADPNAYPIFGWRRVRWEETLTGERYEIREWHFGVDRPAAAFKVAA